jgi:hypothetical protein
VTPWQLLVGVVGVCGAFVPGPCTFDPQRRFDCNLSDPCEENFACARDGYCKSADIACIDGETRCAYPGLTRVGLCVPDGAFGTSKTHCGSCFARCLGAGECVDGRCLGAPAAGRCLLARGHFDCLEGERCAEDPDGVGVADGEGRCVVGGEGPGRLLEACANGADCRAGLCERGLCTSTCDFGCPLGTECDEARVPGGLCVPLDALLDGEVCR